MKKLLLTSAAIAGVAMIASPANAQLSLDLGGYFKGYGAYVDQDEEGTAETNDLDIIRDTEVHFGGEYTLDNGLTVGMHIEAEADGGDAFGVDESYAYFSGSWGRVNFGDEDGASYLLQVAAPSADSNIDGIRQYIQPVNYTVAGGTNLTAVTGGLDYDAIISGKNSKLTYLSPIVNGFQVSVSFTPDNDPADDFEGIGADDAVGIFGRGYEKAAVRYEGMFNNVGVIVGAGYAQNDLEQLLLLLLA
ncbi:MAG: porin [Alphaproteobacteria bacterium]